MTLLITFKTFCKKHGGLLWSFYLFIRHILFAPYMLVRQKKLEALEEETTGRFSFGSNTFPIILSRTNGLIDEEIYWKGVYEEEVLEVIKDVLKDGDTYVDIGTNIGEHALFAAHLLPHGKVLAFEPIKRIFDQCTKSIVLNRLRNVTLYNLACGARDEYRAI